MQLCGREFTAATIVQIEETVRANPTLSRRALSLRVCEWLQWRSINGRPKEVSCRKALLELNRRGLITLPAAEESCFKRSCRRPLTDYPVDAPEGVGPINTSQNTAVGLVLHDTMAFTPEGTPLGLLNVQCWARDPKQAGKKHRRHQLPIEEKESIKWLVSYRAVAEAQKLCSGTTLISVGDREADLYELFQEALQDPYGPKLLIRAERTRNRKVEQEDLWQRINAEPVADWLEVAVPRRASRPARTARLQVRFAQGVLKPPARSKLPPLSLWAVYAREVGHGAEVTEPIDWMLLSTVQTESFEEACHRLSWYGRRWGIEIYHRTLKSGCRIEDRRLDERSCNKNKELK